MSTGAIASTRPEKPPIVNRHTNAMANSIGVSKVSDPFHIVATQLNTFTPVGTAISMVENMKNNWLATGMPVVNMWCAQTVNDRIAMDAVAYTIEAYPNSGFLAKVGMICEMMPNAGRIRMY